MEVWKEYTINDICKTIFAGGDAVKYNPTKNKTEENNIPIYANSVENEGLYGYCSKPLVTEPAVTVAARGAGTGFVCYRKYPYVPIVRLLTLIPNENVDAHFLYYRLKKNFIKGDGSAIPQLTVPMIKKERITLPSLPTQQKIANILSSLDDKIEVNRRINEQLEELAQALFKSWFVEFEPFKDGKFVESELGMIPEGWKVCELSDVLYISKDTINPSKTPDNLFHHYSIPAYDNNKREEAQEGKAIMSNKFKVTNKTTLFSKLNPRIKRVWFIDNIKENAICSTEFVPYKAKNNELTDFVYGLINSDFFYNQAMSIVNGATGSHQRFHPQDTLKFNIAFNESVANEYSSIVEPIVSKILVNQQEITHLTNLRDTLLPKLMSGEIDVNEVEI